MLRRDQLDAQLDRTTDPAEIAYYTAMADAWWDPNGRFKAMHRFNPVRRDYLLAQTERLMKRPEATGHAQPLSGLRVLDIGCGGGLLSEPFAEAGAWVVGIDATARNIEAARAHAAESGLEIDYRHALASTLLAEGEQFDVVVNAEVVEHVLDVPTFLAQTAALTRAGGILFMGTLNRTWRSWFAAILIAEYVARMLPRGTHTHRRFLRPEELDQMLAAHALTRVAEAGVSFNPFHRRWSITRDLGINYLLTYRKHIEGTKQVAE